MKVNGVKHVSFVSPIRENVLILVTFDRSTGVRGNAECEARSSETLASASLYIMATPIETYKNIVSKVLENRIYETRATDIFQEMSID